MIRRNIPLALLALLALLAINNAQFVFDEEQDYYFKDGVLKASTVGDVTNILSQLLHVPEVTKTGLQGYTTASLATEYYGSLDFGRMIIRANNHYVWTSTAINSGTVLRLPSALFCTQFVGIDCVRDSYLSSIASTSTKPNYWRDLPASLKDQLSNYMSYPNYIYLIMSLLQDPLTNPPTTFTVRLVNLLDMDLYNGRVSFTTGFGKAPSSTIPSHQEEVYYAYRSDLLQGIHGTISYDSKSISGAERTFAIDFHVYASNGTFRNSMSISGQTGWVYSTSAANVRELSLGSESSAQISISESPDAVMTIVLYPSTTPPALSGIRKIVPSHITTGVTLEGKWSTRGYYMTGFVPSDTGLWQGWRFVPLQSPVSKGNRYLIINANSTLALEVNPAFGNVTLSTPNKNAPNQIWKVIPSPSPNAFYLRGTNNMCLRVSSLTYLPYSDNAANQHITWLEPCKSTSTRFTFAEFNNYVY